MIAPRVPAGRKLLVFSQFTSMLQIIEAELSARKIRHVMLTGATRNRQALVDEFQAGLAPVFLISLKAGGTGLNLTRADTVIHYDPWWNPAAQAQASDRAYRIGQDKPVFVYDLIVAGSVEERILALQARKRELAEGVLSRDAAVLTPTDVEDLFAPLDV
jgi:SNF2 family DNA or RNA helicase